MSDTHATRRHSGLLSALGPWAVLGLVLASLTVLYADTSRFEGPIGERYVPNILQPGGADFLYPFYGARALLMGVDPYHNDVKELEDPYGRNSWSINGHEYRQVYAPTHLLMFVPLAALTRGDRLVASRIWFQYNLVWLALLAVVSWRLSLRVLPSSESEALWLLLPFFMFVYALSPGVQLLLERGQSDLFISLLCWSATLLALRQRWFLASFLATWATLLKGYPILFLLGLGSFALTRDRWREAVSGGVIAFAVLLLPVIRYVPVALAAMSDRSHMFWAVWYNHSFRNLAYAMSPSWATWGHRGLTLAALAATATCWIQAWHTRADEHAADWFVLFTTCSLGTTLGYSSLSVSYNMIAVLPGAVLIALGQRKILSLAGATRWVECVTGPALAAFLFLLLIARVGSGAFPAAAFGLVGLLATAGAVAAFSLRRGWRNRAMGTTRA